MNPNKIEIALCDDYLPLMEQLENQLKEYFQDKNISYHIHLFTTPSDVYEYMTHSQVHILFMDLKFDSEGEDGILWIGKIMATFPKILVLILTAYENRYKEGFRVRAFRFMTKPLIPQELEENMNDCLQILNHLHTIPIKQKNVVVYLDAKDVLYIEAYSGESKIYTVEQKVYISEKSLLQLETQLQNASFFRTHKSYLINLVHVTDILPSSHKVMMKNSVRLPVARRKWTEFQNHYIRYDVTKKS